MFRRRCKAKLLYEVEMSTGAQVLFMDARDALALCSRELMLARLDLGHARSLGELQAALRTVMQARIAAAERHAAELEKHLVTRTRQLRELESKLGHVVAPFQPDGEMMPSDYADRVAVVLTYWVGKARFAEQELAKAHS